MRICVAVTGRADCSSCATWKASTSKSIDQTTCCVAGERQAGESIIVGVLVRVPVLDTVPVSSEEQDIPLQTNGRHGRPVLLRVEDSGEGFVICNKHKTTTMQIRVNLRTAQTMARASLSIRA